MSIQDWESEDGRKAIQIMGMPDGLYYQDSQDCEGEITCYFHSAEQIPDQLALAALRDDAREWLDTKLFSVNLCISRNDYMYRNRVRSTRKLGFESYDTALIAAILASESK